MPIRPGTLRSSGKAGGTPPASDPRLPPYSPPSASRANKPAGCAAGKCARTRPRRLAAKDGSHPLPVIRRLRFASVGPRYPSRRIRNCDASAFLEVVLALVRALCFGARAGPRPLECGRAEVTWLLWQNYRIVVDTCERMRTANVCEPWQRVETPASHRRFFAQCPCGINRRVPLPFRLLGLEWANADSGFMRVS